MHLISWFPFFSTFAHFLWKKQAAFIIHKFIVYMKYLYYVVRMFHIVVSELLLLYCRWNIVFRRGCFTSCFFIVVENIKKALVTLMKNNSISFWPGQLFHISKRNVWQLLGFLCCVPSQKRNSIFVSVSLHEIIYK